MKDFGTCGGLFLGTNPSGKLTTYFTGPACLATAGNLGRYSQQSYPRARRSSRTSSLPLICLKAAVPFSTLSAGLPIGESPVYLLSSLAEFKSKAAITWRKRRWVGNVFKVNAKGMMPYRDVGSIHHIPPIFEIWCLEGGCCITEDSSRATDKAWETYVWPRYLISPRWPLLTFSDTRCGARIKAIDFDGCLDRAWWTTVTA